MSYRNLKDNILFLLFYLNAYCLSSENVMPEVFAQA